MSGGGAGHQDVEIARLLLAELRRHEPAVAPESSEVERGRAIHALKGSAGLAGERGLAESLARVEHRLRTHDARAIQDAHGLVVQAAAALAAGRSLRVPEWPDPPDDMRALPRDPATFARYAAEMEDRLARIDHALATTGDDRAAALSVFRDVHAMKGAALAALDDVTAWFCHGLEERLRDGERSDETARRALADLTRWRGVLAETIIAPDRALETLRMFSRPSRAPSFQPVGTPIPPPRQTQEPPADGDPRSQGGDGASLRVPTATLDRLFERVRLLGQEHDEVGGTADSMHAMAAQLRGLRMDLVEALHLIGPPRPWGAPEAALRRIETSARALGGYGDRLERASSSLKESADRVRAEAVGAHVDLSAVRTTRAGWLFERVGAAVNAQARREGREVRLVCSGEETAIDRHMAEQLFDPVLQLARNAVTHGIETAAERAIRSKPRIGLIRLIAEARSGGLRLVVQDDGAGVDISDVRVRAVARGTISAETATAADDQTLLSLLFVPGFTTRDSADLLAGRGVGLDLALEAVHRLGGTIRLASQSGAGLSATLDLPFGPGLLKVLWVHVERTPFAMPARRVRRVLRSGDADSTAAVPLGSCLRWVDVPRPAGDPPQAFVVEIEPAQDGDVAQVGVDHVGVLEEVALRAVPPLIAAVGPYAGAIARGTSLHLCLDAHLLAEMIGQAPERPPRRQAP